MKRLILMFMGATLIFFSCSKDEFVEPESVQGDQVTNLKKGNMKVEFTGKEYFYAPGDQGEETPLPNGKILVMGVSATWLDVTNAPLASGLTDWTFNILWDGAAWASSGKYWGKGRMTVKTITPKPGVTDPTKSDDFDIGNDNRGTWDINFHGDIVVVGGSEEPPVLEFTAYTTGVGKSGEVKGMVNHTVDVLNTSVGYYVINGYYLDKNCHPNWRRHQHGGF